MNINLGCELQLLDGWKNLDPRAHLDPSIIPWQWGEKIPFADGSADKILVQHVLMYCEPDKRKKNLSDIFRTLKSGGLFILKEENNRRHEWRKVGTVHNTGHIKSSTNQDEITPVLQEIGFIVTEPQVEDLIKDHGEYINRHRKLRKGLLFCLECRKP